MNGYQKYQKQYFPANLENPEWMKKDSIDKAPIWCSVDLRDGNQALIVPMSLEEKLEFFGYLVRIGFKEIEIGFPAASETEYEFCRTLIERNLIPDDVTIQVLTQAREHIIAKTFEALAGAKHAVVHLYNSTSVAQREQVFKKSKEEIVDIAVFGAKLLNDYAAKTPGHFTFEYSPESFTGTEPDYAVEICNAVIDIWKPTPDRKVIINLPVTVSHSMPHVYANQVEYMCKHLKNRKNLIISLHPHNDRGCAVADSELGLLAGADRIEGTLFGNGERTGNVDIITLALNMYSQGVDPELDFSDLPGISEMYERVTRMHVYERQPYSGALVFAAFSGSHQDAIAKGMKYREDHASKIWNVPYLPIDPTDVGRVYEADVIRINSQSGKGGAAYIMEHNFGFDLPKTMHPEFGAIVQAETDRVGKEISPERINELFHQEYIEAKEPYKLLKHAFQESVDAEGHSHVTFWGTLQHTDTIFKVSGEGNGPIDAFFNAISELEIGKFSFVD